MIKGTFWLHLFTTNFKTFLLAKILKIKKIKVLLISEINKGWKRRLMGLSSTLVKLHLLCTLRHAQNAWEPFRRHPWKYMMARHFGQGANMVEPKGNMLEPTWCMPCRPNSTDVFPLLESKTFQGKYYEKNRGLISNFESTQYGICNQCITPHTFWC